LRLRFSGMMTMKKKIATMMSIGTIVPSIDEPEL
jgi:hypothetical protein